MTKPCGTQVCKAKPATCKSEDFTVDEAIKGNRCSTACDCDGARTCSFYGWCQGTSRTEIPVEVTEPEVEIEIEEEKNWWDFSFFDFLVKEEDKTDDDIPDWDDIIGEDSLLPGDICKSGGVETGPGVNRKDDCPHDYECRPIEGEMAIGGEVNWYCVYIDI